MLVYLPPCPPAPPSKSNQCPEFAVCLSTSFYAAIGAHFNTQTLKPNTVKPESPSHTCNPVHMGCSPHLVPVPLSFHGTGVLALFMATHLKALFCHLSVT